MTFETKIMEKLQKVLSLSHLQPQTIMQSVSAGLKADTLFAEMSPLIYVKRHANAQTFTPTKVSSDFEQYINIMYMYKCLYVCK